MSYSRLLFIFLLAGGMVMAGNDSNAQTSMTSVTDFGARGDNLMDDTEAIRRAVNSGTVQIYFPEGMYRITSSIEINLDRTGPVSLNGFGSATVIMEGAGPAFIFTGTHSGSADPGQVKENVWKNQRMPLIDGIEIVGKHPKSVGVEISGTMQMTITRVLVRNALHGIRLYNRNRNIIISDCHIYNNSGYGIFLDNINLHQINITGSHISYNGGGGIVVKNGDVHNIQIGTCDIECNMYEKGPPAANILIDVSEGALLEGAITGCTIQHYNTIPGSSNIRLIGHGTDKRTEIGNITIADNQISETQDNIHLKYVRGIIITGNTFYMGQNHNILVEQSDNILIGNNIFDKNPHYGKKTMDTKDNIVLVESNNLTITGLHLYNPIGEPAGILIEKCKNYNLTNSTLVNCNFAGISVRDSENGKISGNFITDDRTPGGKPVAINVEGGKNNLIINNFTNGAINGVKGSAIISGNQAF